MKSPDLSSHDRPFNWVDNDCSDLVRSAVLQLSGRDIKHDDPGYKTRRGAVAALRARGYRSLSDMLDDRLAAVPPAHARPGDAVAFGRMRLGVCMGRVARLVGPSGLEPRPMKMALRAWRARCE